MISTTLNGKLIIIEYNRKINKYIVYYEGDVKIMNEKPYTDQDREQYEQYIKLQLNQARQDMINIRIEMFENSLNV